MKKPYKKAMPYKNQKGSTMRCSDTKKGVSKKGK